MVKAYVINQTNSKLRMNNENYLFC